MEHFAIYRYYWEVLVLWERVAHSDKPKPVDLVCVHVEKDQKHWIFDDAF